MTTKLIVKDDIQYPVVASGVMAFDDLMPDGVTPLGTAAGTRNLNLATLPTGATITAGGLVVLQGWFGPTSITVDIGDDDSTDVDPDRYTPTPLTIPTTPVVKTITPTNYRTVDPCILTMEWVFSGFGSSLGLLIWWVEYIVHNRVHETYG